MFCQVKNFLNVFFSGTRLWFEIMKMLQLGSAKNVNLGVIQDNMIDATSYDVILNNQAPPRVLATHLPTTWLSPNFRFALFNMSFSKKVRRRK